MKHDRLLIIKLGALGDIVQAEGAIHDIRCAWPASEITLLTTPPYRKLLERCPWVDRVLVDPRASRFRIDRMLGLRKVLRRLRADMVYDLQQVGRTDFYYRFMLKDTPWLGGAKGCSHHCRRPEDRCAADHFKISLQQAGLATRYCLESDVSWMAEDMTELLYEYELAGDFVALIPGCSAKHPEKRWTGYRDLAGRLVASGIRVVTIPGPDELELCRQIPGDMLLKNGRWLDYFQLAGVLKKARFIVGNDTGPTHIGAHLRKQGLALFGSHSKPLHTGIQHSLFEWIEHPDIEAISLEKVLEAVTRNCR